MSETIAKSSGAWTISLGDGGNPWSTKSPKQDTLKVVKLTKDNLQRIGKELLATGAKVQVREDAIRFGYDRTFDVGQYLIEEWDYDEDQKVYRTASRADRVKYDLR